MRLVVTFQVGLSRAKNCENYVAFSAQKVDKSAFFCEERCHLDRTIEQASKLIITPPSGDFEKLLT